MSLPAFAVLGHPNEGKSSVVSTLTEDERVRVSARPGETRRLSRHEIRIEDEAVLEIIDTPGFQNPAATLAWLTQWRGPESEMVDAFIRAHEDHPDFHHDVELMKPLRERAGVLYVADASRPLREVDLQEMEVLRLTGLPRMALLNCKREQTEYLTDWREALVRRFNLVREFNAHRATFAERMALLEAMALLNPEQESRLRELRARLEEDWEFRIRDAVLLIEELCSLALRHRVKSRLREGEKEEGRRSEAEAAYRRDLRAFEERARTQWRKLFHHQELPGTAEESEDPLLEELFAEKVWRLLGLSRRQLATAGAAAGGAVGVGADLAAGGITFGVFSLAGTLLGGAGGWIGGPRIGRRRWPLPGHRPLASEYFQVGPCQNPQLGFVLLDRSLLYLIRLMNWAHARRDHQAFLDSLRKGTSLVRAWSDGDRDRMSRWLRALMNPRKPVPEDLTSSCREFLSAYLRRRP